jgi:nitroreductase
MNKVINQRQTEFAVNPIFPTRHSPRAFNGKGIDNDQLMQLFEAARWAPSSYNSQPWRFIYGHRDTPAFAKLFELLVEFNQSWAKNAAALILIISKKTFEHNGQVALTRSFDTGAAWENLALETSISGLAAHGMQGFDYERAREAFQISDDYEVEAMAAIGHPAPADILPPELQDQETPSERKKVSEIVAEGEFGW